jgi:hypothetical protein
LNVIAALHLDRFVRDDDSDNVIYIDGFRADRCEPIRPDLPAAFYSLCRWGQAQNWKHPELAAVAVPEGRPFTPSLWDRSAIPRTVNRVVGNRMFRLVHRG